MILFNILQVFNYHPNFNYQVDIFFSLIKRIYEFYLKIRSKFDANSWQKKKEGYTS